MVIEFKARVLSESFYIIFSKIKLFYINILYRNSSKVFLIFSTNLLEISLGDTNEGIELKIVMSRRIINELMTTYLPTVFVLVIVYATNFFKPFFFETVVSVNLTSQLVLTTLFISVSKSLPPTAYVKFIDVWLIFCQLIPFVEVVLKLSCNDY